MLKNGSVLILIGFSFILNLSGALFIAGVANTVHTKGRIRKKLETKGRTDWKSKMKRFTHPQMYYFHHQDIKTSRRLIKAGKTMQANTNESVSAHTLPV